MKPILLAISYLHLLLYISPAFADPYFLCLDTSNYTSNTGTFQTNLNLLLPSLSSNATANDGFYTATRGEHPDQVHALALCRGDVIGQECQECLERSNRVIVRRCPQNRSAIIWHNQCMLRYSNRVFFGVLDTSLNISRTNLYNATRPDQPSKARKFMYELIENFVSVPKMYAGKFNCKTVDYGLVQCSRDLSIVDCKACLSRMMEYVSKCCEVKRGWRVLGPNCWIRYETYLFFELPEALTSQPPTGNFFYFLFLLFFFKGFVDVDFSPRYGIWPRNWTIFNQDMLKIRLELRFFQLF